MLRVAYALKSESRRKFEPRYLFTKNHLEPIYMTLKSLTIKDEMKTTLFFAKKDAQICSMRVPVACTLAECMQ